MRTDLSSRVGAMNPAWNQSTDSKAVDVSARSSFIHPKLISRHIQVAV